MLTAVADATERNPDGIVMIEAKSAHALLMLLVGYHDAASDRMLEVLSDQSRVIGAYSAESADAMTNLGVIYCKAGEPRNAIR